MLLVGLLAALAANTQCDGSQPSGARQGIVPGETVSGWLSYEGLSGRFLNKEVPMVMPRTTLALLLAASLCAITPAIAQQAGGPGIIRHIGAASERLELAVNTSRMLTLDKPIPKALVDNPEIVELHPRGANVIQVVAKKAGFTTITLWDDGGRVYSVDTLVTGDSRELSMYLERQFPNARLRVMPLASSVVISGYVDDPAEVKRIEEIALDFYPKVINNITVGGVQQVLLRVKVMEVSRTKLRQMGFDFGFSNADGGAISSISGLLSATVDSAGTVTGGGGGTVTFGIASGSMPFFAALNALKQNNLMKILAEPNLVTVSGRPAFFNSGGEFPILVPQSLGTVSIEYKKYGTQIDFVPIVLANGNIRLEVRPRVSEIDNSRAVALNDDSIPALRVREVDTGVEMQAGQTLAIAGLVQTRMDAETRGIPFLMDIPYLGACFRRVQTEENEVELLILVTPELVEAMDCHEVPASIGPGLSTQSPRDCELYGKGYIEVPRCAPGGAPAGHGPEGYEQLPPGAQIVPGETEVLPAPDGASPGPAAPPAGSPSTPGPNSARRPTTRPTAYASANRSAELDRSALTPAKPRDNSVQRLPASPRQLPAGQQPGFIGPTGYDVR